MISKIAIPLALLVLATAAMPAQAYYYHHRYHHYGYRYHGGNYNYGGPHYSASDRYNNSRQLNGTR